MLLPWFCMLLLLRTWFGASAYVTDFIDHTTQSSGTASETPPNRRLGAVGKVKNFQLINVDTNAPISILKNDMVINIDTIGTQDLNVQASIWNGTVASIRFGYNGNPSYRTESSRPFALCGDSLPIGNYFKCNILGVGRHTISATPYSVSGEVGATMSVSFLITASTINEVADESAKSSTSCNAGKFAESEWHQITPNYPVSVGEPQGVVIGDEIVMFGGFINKFTDVINHTYARDVTVASSPWRRMEDMPLLVGVTHTAAVAIGMKVYLCGGYQGGHPGPHVPYCFVYDHSKAPGKNQWSRIADLPNNGSAGAGMIYDTTRNVLYYAGGGQRVVHGSPHPVDIDNTWKYSFDNPKSGWTATKSVPYAANHLSAVTHRNAIGKERHFFVGGQKGEYEITDNLADTFEFDAAKETWIRRASMPLPRSHATASTRAVRCGFIMAGGSFNSMTNKKNRTTNISYYDILSNSWTSIGNTPVAMATPVVVIHPSGYMYFIDNTQLSFRRRFKA